MANIKEKTAGFFKDLGAKFLIIAFSIAAFFFVFQHYFPGWEIKTLLTASTATAIALYLLLKLCSLLLKLAIIILIIIAIGAAMF